MTFPKYQKNSLTKVILNLKFPQILGLNENNPPSEFQRKIMKQFPYVHEKRGENVSFEFHPNKPVINREPKIKWEFKSKNNLRTVSIDEESLIIEFSKYTVFEEFYEVAKFIFEQFTEIYNTGIFRIGLRYINEIREKKGNPRDWKDIINPSLISISEDFLDPEDKLVRSMHVLELKEDDYHFRFQFGMFNSNYPSRLTKKEFVLDYDCISTEDLEKEAVFNTIEKFHEIIDEWFNRSIGPKQKEKMGEIKQ